MIHCNPPADSAKPARLTTRLTLTHFLINQHSILWHKTLYSPTNSAPPSTQ